VNDPIILSYNGQSPTIDKNAWVAPAAVVSGDTRIGGRVLDRAVVGRQGLVAAGSVVREGTTIPAGELWAGAPADKTPVSGKGRITAHAINYWERPACHQDA
jgi:carbonic anhydrase/acetyltransferase-like protein (isoleucine patch superfamily)